MITRDDVKSVAALARLELDDAQLDRMTAELGGILEHIAKLTELGTEDISPTSQILDLRNVLREDTMRPSLPTEAILANAPDREENCFRVRAVLGVRSTRPVRLYELTIHEAARLLRAGEVTSVDLTAAVFARIAEVEGSVRAYLTLLEDRAMSMAAEADRRRARGEDGPLLGVPVALKDVLCLNGERTTAASRILEHFVPPYSATVVQRLEAAGAVFIGKTNLDEFAMGSSTEHSAYFPTHNPWNLDTVPGGSSGGSAAAVSADMALASLGSDTGGSIRQPASLCGVVGLKADVRTRVSLRPSRLRIVTRSSGLSRRTWQTAPPCCRSLPGRIRWIRPRQQCRSQITAPL